MARSGHFVKRLSFVAVLCLFVSIVISLASLGVLYHVLADNDRTILQGLQEIILIEKLRSAVQYRVASYRGYILGGERRFEQEHQAADEEVRVLLEKLRSRLDGRQEKLALSLLEQVESDYREAIQTGIACQKEKLPTKALLQCLERDILPKRAELVRLLENLETEKEKELTDAKQAAAKASAQYLLLIIGITATALLLLIGTAVVLTRFLRRQAEDLAEANKELEEFSSIVAHDVKSPLYTISGFLELLREEYRDKLDSEGRHYIDSAVNGATRLSTFVDRLLKYARFGAEKVELTPLDLNIAVEEALSNLKAVLDRKSATIDYKELPKVKADKSQMVQLFQNLIGNAIKFHDNGRPHVKISAEPNGIYWKLSVQDNGIGFDSASAQSIFEPFHRLHSEEKFQGSGLGLSVCKKIIDRHGGRIWATSKPNEGATFHFTLARM